MCPRRSAPAACFRSATFLLVLALSSRATTATAAQGLNLAWNHCLGEGTGVQNAAFACDTNVGSHRMTGSFVLGVNMNDVIGHEIVIELASASPALPAWWTLYYVGSCRPTSLVADFVADASDIVCADWSLGQGVGGIGTYCTSTGSCADRPASSNLVRVKLVVAVPQAQRQDLVAGTEYFAFNLAVNHTKTVGTGSCAGCETPVCIVLNSIKVVPMNNIGTRDLTTPTAPGTNFVTWQGGGVPVTPHGFGCPAATATRRSAWGAVKALYR